MKILEIIELPTTVNDIHESVYRSFSILEKVTELLKAGTPADVVLSLIEEMQAAPKINRKL